MILKLQVTKVIPGSFEKEGKKYDTLELLCMDLGDGRRLGHSVLFAPDRDQRDQALNADLRDKVIVCDVETVTKNFSGAIVFRGFIDPAAFPAEGGKLKIDKGGVKAPAPVS